MASGTIPQPSIPSVPTVLTVSEHSSRPADFETVTIKAWRVGYFIYVTYTITVTATFGNYTTISEIPNARPYNKQSKTQVPNFLMNNTGALKVNMAPNGDTSSALFQCIVSVAGTYGGSFIYLTDVAP